ncbi:MULTISPECIES: peptide cleavage/export ABC transporter [unclassified Streptococcus]|uniref:peptide cleavage/export ABC transporter n=1 Tax=unclassified Streptococcus TaxID=2608887 RepID=UPI0018ABBFCD|nr:MULTISPECIES: peptide cleavage/export ABC transporter [unclassified Streptococcus]MBF8969808.1 peptide cleavage/export ABC transporter [Streptococcus sp. NLN76]MBG9366697.1 peptide cleavage/export ABC transporter [Streptococcus sp. NLN64]
MKQFHKTFVAQIDARDCGVAVLASIAKFYDSDYSIAHLRDLAKTNKDGTTALGIVTAAETIGFETQAVKADMSLFDLEDTPYPFIAHVVKNGTLLHYYVIYGISNGDIIIGDPDPTVKITKKSKSDFAKEWTGVSIFLKPGTNYQPHKDEKKGLQQLLPLIYKQKRIVFGAILTSILVTMINIGGSYYLQFILDQLIPQQNISTLSMITIGLSLSYLLQQIFLFSREYLLTHLNQKLSRDIILNYIRHVLKLPMSFFETRQSGDIISRFTDANSIIDALASSVMSLFLDVTMLFLIGGALIYQNLQLFLISMLAIPIYTIIIVFFVKPFEKMNLEVMQSNSEVSSSIIESLTGIETIKALTNEEGRLKKIETDFETYLSKSLRLSKFSITQDVLKQGTQLLFSVLILWVGAQFVIDSKITIGQLITFNTLLGYFTSPLENVIRLQTKLQTAQVANNRLNEVYQVKPEFTSYPSYIPGSLNGNIKIENLSFRYGFGADTLTDIHLEIQRGDKISLVGVSGSGKTTLAKMLVGFFTPYNGNIYMNEHPLNQIDKKILRQHIHYVPQQAFLFNGTILDNLLSGIETDVNETEIIDACKLAEIHQDILKMPMAYQTELTDHSGLSGGQKQRIAIARALLTKAPVLILDEATNGLDILTEKKVLDNLLSLQDKTIIFVAHRLTVSERTPKIVVLENGKIVESGSHWNLMQLKGYYYELFNK